MPESGYSFSQVFRQEPAVIVSAIMAWLAVLVVAGVITWSKETLTAVQSALTITLLLGWVRQATVSKDALNNLPPSPLSPPSPTPPFDVPQTNSPTE